MNADVRDWIFTFGYGQLGGQGGHTFVRINGTYEGARAEMLRRFGREWSNQYGSEDEAGVERFGLHQLGPAINARADEALA